MSVQPGRLSRNFLTDARKYLDMHVPRIERCLALLGEKETWWRPNKNSNSAGNVVLHLSGNIRQWIISGLGGAPDIRRRDEEFAARGPMPRRALVAQFRGAVTEALRVLDRLTPADLERDYVIQGFHVSGLVAVSQVTQHLSYHAGQIIYLTKMKTSRDLHFTKLPPLKPAKKSAGSRPVWPPVPSPPKRPKK